MLQGHVARAEAIFAKYADSGKVFHSVSTDFQQAK